MTSIPALLAELESRGIILFLADGEIRYRSPRDALTPADREALRRAGFSDRDIWDIAAVVGFFNMSNRIASATDMRPNEIYHGMAR